MAKSISQLKKEVEQLERRNRELAKIRAAKAKADKERRDLEEKYRKLKSAVKNKSPSRLRENLKNAGKKASPLLRRVKASLDEAARNY